MPEEKQWLPKAQTEIMDAIIFEQWIRFYFIDEMKTAGESKEAVLIPNKAMERIHKRYGKLAFIAELLNYKPVHAPTSKAVIMAYIKMKLCGSVIPADCKLESCLDTSLAVRLRVFNLWVRQNITMLSKRSLAFDRWCNLFEAYLETDAGRKLQQETEKNL